MGASAPKTYQQLNEQKLAILRFLDNHVDKLHTVIHGIVSAADIYSSVQQQAEDMLRVSLKHVDMEDKDFIKQLYQFYEGSGSGDQQRSAPSMHVKIRIVSILI